MPDSQNGRLAVYLDFDNIVMSWYDRVHGRNSYSRDRQRIMEDPTEPEIADRLRRATIDVGAIIDYAASFGTLVLTRAYADWSSPVNAIYRSQLVARAIDLVQLFPAAAYAKNGADIRLAVDAVEDMFRLPDLTHVLIVAGDSDYVPLAQRCRRLGRYVIGVGVAGSTAKALAAACDEFDAYDSLPGVAPIVKAPPKTSGRETAASKEAKEIKAADAAAKTADTADDAAAAPATKSRGGGRRGGSKTAAAGQADTGAKPAGDAASAAESPVLPSVLVAEAIFSDAGNDAAAVEASLVGALDQAAPPKRASRRVTSKSLASAAEAAAQAEAAAAETAEDPQDIATRLLERALRLGHDKNDAEWLHSSEVKTHMRRMDPSFNEKALGYRSFSDFVKARADIAELEETGHERLVRLVTANA
jgi:hypothetical protein